MELSKKESEEKPKNLWKFTDPDKYQYCVTIDSTIKSEEVDKKVVYMDDLEKRKEAYGICGECNEPGTGAYWCQPCNAKRFKENFKNWTSGNKNVDELIQHSQLNATHASNCLEWFPFENFQNVAYIAKGGFSKIYAAYWANEGYIHYWDIENQRWDRSRDDIIVGLKSLDNSSDISTDFLSEIKSHLQIYAFNVVRCYGITQNPDTKDFMMVLRFCKNGNLRNYSNQAENYDYVLKIKALSQVARGLLDIHNAEKVHKDFHSGNILLFFEANLTYISDLGLCQPANKEKQSVKKEGIYGVLPYVAPEVLRGSQYTKAANIYSFGIIMNELMSEEITYHNIPHDQILTIGICQGLRPKISEDTPKLLADLIMKCWDAKAENRPTAKELYQLLNKWNIECGDYDSWWGESRCEIDKNSEIYIQMEEYRKVRENKLKNKPDEDKPKNIQTHPQAIYTSRLLNFKNLPEPVNSSDLSPYQCNTDAMLSVAIQFQNMWSESGSDKPNQDDQNEG